MNAVAAVRPLGRLGSIDAFRGLVMLLMLGEVLRLSRVAEAFPESGFWAFLAVHQSHVPWVGCSVHDLIQPAFSFLVGVALPFSIASRIAKGEGMRRMVTHALWRATLLVFLGIFLRSIGWPQLNFTFEDTLTQIGLGYPFLFVMGFCSLRWQWVFLSIILLGYWAAFALYPLPGAGFDWTGAGADPDWEHGLTGFAAHWNKNTNAAWAFDRWFLNLLPREEPFTHNGGGYCTLSFIPTLGTMILGLFAGQWLRSDLSPQEKIRRLVSFGLAGLALGWVFSLSGICPVVKRIWTPAWTLFSGGWCFLLLAAFYSFVDVGRFKFWVFPLIVVGMNSIAAYCMDHLCGGFIRESLRTVLGGVGLSADVRSALEGFLVLLCFWLILYWMYRRKIFLKI